MAKMMSEIPVLESQQCHHVIQKINGDPIPIYNQIMSLCDEPVNYFWLGRQSFQPVWDLQKMIHAARVENRIPDVVLLLEHDPVYTFGKNANRDHLLPSYSKDADVISIDRGGDVTFHGPGQLIVYPILNLRDYRKSVSWYMRSLEEVVILTLKEFGIESHIRDGMTGVWIDDEKICAMGVRLSRWVSMHGLALNLDTDLAYFNGIIPCGIFECGVTSLNEQTRYDISMPQLMESFMKAFKAVIQPTLEKYEEL